MPSLSDLIFKSRQNSSNNELHRGSSTDRHEKSDSNSQSNAEFLREKYVYDPIDDFYNDGNVSPSSRERSGRNYSSRVDDGSRTENTPNQQRQQSSQPSSQPSSILKTPQSDRRKSQEVRFDFQENVKEREFFESSPQAKKRQEQQDQLEKRQGSAKKRRRSIYEEETKEEYEERMHTRKLFHARRKRFRRKKYNFYDEIDYGGSISTMVKYQMDAKGAFKNLKVGHDDRLSSNGRHRENDTHGVLVQHGEEMNQTGDGGQGVHSNNDDNSTTDSTDSKTDQNIQNNEHVLGSLLNRIKKQDQKNQKEGDTDDPDADYEYGTAQMLEDPTSFQSQGYSAPLHTDPNILEYSYVNSASSNITYGIPANITFKTEHEQSRDNFGKESRERDARSIGWKKLSSIAPQRNKVVSENNVILPHFLPLNCFNPNMKKLHRPRQHADSYHYLPFSHQDPTSTRILTSTANSIKQLFNSFDDSSFYTRKFKTLWPLHFHSRNITIIAARLIVSCAGLLSVNDNEEEEDEMNSLSNILSWLYRRPNTSSRTIILIRQSQELASNYLLWEHLGKRIEALHSQGVLQDEEYYFLKRELLSEHSEMLTNENVTSYSAELKENLTFRRRRIFKLIKDLEEDEVSSNEDSANSKVTSNNEDSTNNDEDGDKSIPPWRPSYSSEKAQKVKNINDLIKLNKGEKYSQVLHASDIDIETIHLTLAVLYSELCRQRSSKQVNTNSNTDAMMNEKNLHETIMAYLETLQNEIWFVGDNHKVGKFYNTTLNAVLAETILLRQSYVSNSETLNSNTLPVKNNLSDELSDEDYDESDEDDNKVDQKDLNFKYMTDFRHVGDMLVKFGSDIRGDSKLFIFSDIHMTTGIATLARVMPTYAAEIISRSTINHEVLQTPFDLMKGTLEAMEEKDHIMRKQLTGYINDSNGSIGVDTLMKSMTDAADIFKECHELDPNNIDCLCWYVATKIGLMLLGSGIVIGKGPMLARPPDYLVEESGIDSNSRHRDYSEQRANASLAVRLLISWQSRATDQSAMYYYHVKNLLEWSEATFLLSFRPTMNKNCLRKISLLHASHTITWAMKDPTIEAIDLILHLYKNELISHGKVLSFMSSLVERNSTISTCWAMLALSLGPLGSSGKKFCKKENCNQCSRLNNGFFFNHKKVDKQRRRHDWWGLTASSWWDSHFFTCSVIKSAKRKDLRNIDACYEQIKVRLHSSSNAEEHSFCLLKENKKKIKRNLIDLTWMWSDEPSEEDEEDQMDSSSETDDISLNRDKMNSEGKNHFMLPEKNKSIHNFETFMINHLQSKWGHKLLILVSKILTASHLFGLNHNFVEYGVKHIWDEYLQRKNDVEFDALSFLCAKNINIMSFLDDKRREFNGKYADNQSFPFSFATM